MSDEMKLLYAMCKGLGLEVKVTLDYEERKETYESAMIYNTGYPGASRKLKADPNTNELCIDDDGKYTSVLIKPIASYTCVPKG
jgi:hypothetical protein